ncbi:LysR family transcriptional regulator [Alicyclobacillus curvatus]|jgi:LysR family transcriptional regulator, transcriptional activator of the cysJI operon|nr:LysR family transcriptional regulator [Alicyclobacillus curvatus]
MLTLQQLRAFVLTVRYRKLASVAQAMDVRQPTITFHLSKLEEAVSLPIFVSNSRQTWRLTDFGQSLYQYAERMITLEDEILALVEDTAQLKKGKVRIGSTHTPATYLFPQVLSTFRSHYRDVGLSLDVAPSHLLLPKVLNYDLDFCCINYYPSGESDLQAQPIVEDEFVVICHPDSEAAQATDLQPSDFARFPIIMHERSSMSRQVIDNWFQEHRVQPNVLMDVSGTETMKQMVKQNLGVAIVSGLSCREERAQGQLVTVSLPGFAAKRIIYAVHRKDVRLSHAAEIFLHMLKQAGLQMLVKSGIL